MKREKTEMGTSTKTCYLYIKKKVYNETKSQNKLQKYGWVGKKKFGQNKKLVRKNATTGLCVSVEKRVF